MFVRMPDFVFETLLPFYSCCGIDTLVLQLVFSPFLGIFIGICRQGCVALAHAHTAGNAQGDFYLHNLYSRDDDGNAQVKGSYQRINKLHDGPINDLAVAPLYKNNESLGCTGKNSMRAHWLCSCEFALFDRYKLSTVNAPVDAQGREHLPHCKQW